MVYGYLWRKIPLFTFNENKQFETFITIVIPARNEEENIGGLLDSIKKQTYPLHLFEVIVVDDFSTDNTKLVIQSYVNPQIKYVSLKDYVSSENSINSFKKKAIEIGISLSKGELIVTTDADCVVNENWLSVIASFYELHRPDMIVMPVVIEECNTPVQIFQSLDFMSLQGVTGAAVFRQLHGMCNGANLAYKKSAFEEVGGFEGIDHIASGDDMLLLQKFAFRNKNGIKYLKSQKAIVRTKPVNSINAFIQQRIRWASKADKYPDKSLFPVLLIVYLLNCFFLLLLMGSLFYKNEFQLFSLSFTLGNLLLFSVAVKVVSELIFLFPVSSFFNKAKLLVVFPLYQPAHILYVIIAGWLGKFGKYHWKERKVK